MRAFSVRTVRALRGMLLNTGSSARPRRRCPVGVTTSGGCGFAARFEGVANVEGLERRALLSGVPVETVALNTDDAPGTTDTFGAFPSIPTINATGTVAFNSGLSGADVTGANGSAVFVGAPGSVALVAREGDALPGDSGATYGDLSAVTVSDSGKVGFASFKGNDSSTTADDECADLAGAAGSVATLAQSGAAVPGIETGVTYSPVTLGAAALGDANNVAFTTLLAGAAANRNVAVVAGTTGSLTVVAREGGTAPGGGAFTAFAPDAVVNASGQFAFLADAGGLGIFTGTPGGSLTAVARAGADSPAGTGVKYATLNYPTLNVGGQVAFYSTLSGTGVTSSNNAAIFVTASGIMKVVARSGTTVPNTSLTYGALSHPSIATDGEIGFLAGLNGSGVTSSNNAAIFVREPHALDMIVREGDLAPGTPTGTRYIDFHRPVVNSGGQVVFLSGLYGPGVTGATSADREGLFATDTSGNVLLIAREGDVIDLGGGDVRTIKSLTFANNSVTQPLSGGQDGHPASFNDAGQLTFAATFTDGSSGVFRATAQRAPNQAPKVTAMTPASGTVERGATVALTAAASDSDGAVTRVTFYRESNATAGLQTGAGGDAIVATDTDPANGWSISAPTAALPLGDTTYYAQATDDESAVSDALAAPSATITVQDTTAPTVDVVDVSPDPRTTAVDSVKITFSEPVTGFDDSALSLVRAGPAPANLLTSSSLTLTTTDNTTFTLAGLSSITGTDGQYTLAVNTGAVADAAGNPLAAGATDEWTKTTAQDLVVSATAVSAPEGSSGQFTVNLQAQPASNVTVTIARQSGDGDLSTSPTTLTFTPANWNVAQAVQVAAAQDADTTNGTATFAVSSTGLTTKTVTATEVDDDKTAVTGWTLADVADAHVRGGSTYGGTNYGTNNQIATKLNSDVSFAREAYIKFDLSTVTSVKTAKLRLWGMLSDATQPSTQTTLYTSSNTTWKETGTGALTWNNKPATNSTLTTLTITGTTGKWYEWDVTTFLKAEKAAGRTLVTFVLKNPYSSGPLVTFNSKEATSNKPQLVVTA